MFRKKTSKFKQGVFVCNNKDKYRGSTPILYRSSYELSFMKWCDNNPAVVYWGSETIIIPYQNPMTGRVHRYFVDFNLTLKTKDNILSIFTSIVNKRVESIESALTKLKQEETV